MSENEPICKKKLKILEPKSLGGSKVKLVGAMPFRCLVPAEATPLIRNERVRVEEAEGLSDCIVTVSGDEQEAVEEIIRSLYAAQEAGHLGVGLEVQVAEGEQGIFVLLVPQSFPFSDQEGWQKVLDCGAQVQLEADAIHGTEDRAIQLLGSLEQTLKAVLVLQELIIPDSPEVFSEEEILLEPSDAWALCIG